MELTPVAEFESEADAAEAIALLHGAGIRAAFDEHELLVPEEYAQRAIHLLNASAPPAQTPATATLQCPECGSFETRTVPPWSAIYLTVLVASLFFARWQSSRTMAGISFLLMAAWPFFLRLLRTSGKQKCRRCGWLFSVD